MPYTAINGAKLHYEVHGGSGDWLVFVHGYTGDISDWRNQVPEFSEAYRVLVLDQIGHGRSEAPQDRSVYTIPRMARDVETLAEHVGLERYHLVGHSMGGGVVQEVALHHPKRLLSLTLEDTSSRFAFEADPRAVEVRERRRHLAETQGMSAVANDGNDVAPAPHMPPQRSMEEKERVAAISVDAYLGAWEGLAGWEGTEARAIGIQTPTLIVVGDLDSAMIMEGSLKLERLVVGSKLAVIPEAGHSPQWERPDLFNATLRSFLAEHPG